MLYIKVIPSKLELHTFNPVEYFKKIMLNINLMRKNHQVSNIIQNVRYFSAKKTTKNSAAVFEKTRTISYLEFWLHFLYTFLLSRIRNKNHFPNECFLSE